MPAVYGERRPHGMPAVRVSPGIPSYAGKGETTLRRAPLAVNDGRQCRKVSQGVGEGRVLRPGEPGESEATPGHEVRRTPRPVLPPDHGAPDHLGRKAQGSERGREFEGAGCPEPDEIEVLDLCAHEAEVEEVDRPHAPHPHGGMLRQRHARHCPFLPLCCHRLLSLRIGNACA